jgi:hypothetical protein
LTDAARDATGANDAVDKGHPAYSGGQVTGDVVDRLLMKGIASKSPLGLNPWGRRGSPAHVGRVLQAETSLRGKGWSTISGGSLPEKAIPVLGGRWRYPDLVMEKNGKRIAIQVGRVKASGSPVSREVKALNDLRNSGQFNHVWFLRY